VSGTTETLETEEPGEVSGTKTALAGETSGTNQVFSGKGIPAIHQKIRQGNNEKVLEVDAAALSLH
jgi:hypothetical protein